MHGKFDEIVSMRYDIHNKKPLHNALFKNGV